MPYGRVRPTCFEGKYHAGALDAEPMEFGKKTRLFCSLQLVRFLCKDYTSRDVKSSSCSTMIKLISFFLSEQQL